MYVLACDQSCCSFVTSYNNSLTLSSLLSTHHHICGGAPWDRSHFFPYTQRVCNIEEPDCVFDYVILSYTSTIRAFSAVYPSLKSCQDDSSRSTWISTTHRWRAGEDWGPCASHQRLRADGGPGKIKIWNNGGGHFTPLCMPWGVTWPEATQKRFTSSRSSSTDSPPNHAAVRF